MGFDELLHEFTNSYALRLCNSKLLLHFPHYHHIKREPSFYFQSQENLNPPRL